MAGNKEKKWVLFSEKWSCDLLNAMYHKLYRVSAMPIPESSLAVLRSVIHELAFSAFFQLLINLRGRRPFVKANFFPGESQLMLISNPEKHS